MENNTPGKSQATQGRPVNAELTPAIINAVLAILAESGYARLTAAAVAKRAGVSVATLYRRWPSKRDLLFAAARSIADSETSDVDSGSTAEDLRAMLAHKSKALSGQISATLVSLVGESAHDPDLAAIMRSVIFEPTYTHLATILERARERGEAASKDASSATHLIVGMILSRVAFQSNDSDASLLPESDITLLIRAITGVRFVDDTKEVV